MRSRLGMRMLPKLVFVFVLIAMMVSAAYAPSVPPPPLWSDPVGTFDIALSADGQYVAVGTNGAVRFYGKGSSTPLWIYSSGTTDFYSVAISADGTYLAAGAFGQIYFWANAKSLTGNPPPTWTSLQGLGGFFEPRCLAISADGNYVAACGTGERVFYWAGATGKSGIGIATTWDFTLAVQVLAIAISDDGNHVAAAGFNGPPTDRVGVLGYWNNAKSLTGHPQPPTWVGQELHEIFVDVAISDDGNYVVVAGAGEITFSQSTVYYWAGGTSRTGTSEPHTWAGGVDVVFLSVDISSNGGSVIAGSRMENGGSVYFWGGARALTGNPAPSWTHTTSAAVADVAINDAGTYMAAVDQPFTDTLHFFDKQGNVLWENLNIAGDKLSMSCDGKTLAVGTSLVPDTAYLFDTGYSSPCGTTPTVGTPVGGFVAPVNKLTVFAPYLALFGVVAAVAIIVWKRPEH